jgi:endothelin-converting enzyme
VVNILQQVGYPTASPAVLDPNDVKTYYENLKITKSYFENGRSYAKFSYEKNWNDLLKPVDKNRWSMTAPTVNANYNPVYNRISFPAGIMSTPAFSLALPEYVSYGAFGSTAGHELTHGFDNSGSKYDETGRFVEWWDNATITKFKQKGQCFIDQYSNYSIPGVDGERVHVKGKLTQGENIADAGGLASSFAAWQKREKASPNQLLPGLERYTKEQMFYISYANWRCGKTRTAQAVQNVYSDPHSPTGIREIGALANSKGFREAFNCPIKKPTCELW